LAKKKTVKKNAKEKSGTTLKVVDRAFEVLNHISLYPSRATDVAKQLNYSWATMHRTVSQLEMNGYLKKDEYSNRYTVGQSAWLIGTSYIAHHHVLEVAQSYLDEVANNSELAVQLIEKAGNLSLVLYSHQTSKNSITKANYGYHFPLHCGSKGLVLLAFSESDFIKEYLKGELISLTPSTISDPKVLAGELTKIKKDGYAITHGDVQVFTSSIAAPIFDRGMKLCGAVTFITTKSNLQKNRDELLEQLLKTSQSISMGLGWRPGGTTKG